MGTMEDKNKRQQNFTRQDTTGHQYRGQQLKVKQINITGSNKRFSFSRLTSYCSRRGLGVCRTIFSFSPVFNTSSSISAISRLCSSSVWGISWSSSRLRNSRYMIVTGNKRPSITLERKKRNKKAVIINH